MSRLSQHGDYSELPPRRRKRPVGLVLGSAGLGFICGALFWHLIGFWSFVSDVVLRGPNDAGSRQVQETPRDQGSAQLRTTGSISPVRPVASGRSAKGQSCAGGAGEGDGCSTEAAMPTAKAVAKKDDVEVSTRVVAPAPSPVAVQPTQVVPAAKATAPASWSTTIQAPAR